MEITILNTTSEIPVNIEIHKDTYYIEREIHLIKYNLVWPNT